MHSLLFAPQVFVLLLLTLCRVTTFTLYHTLLHAGTARVSAWLLTGPHTARSVAGPSTAAGQRVQAGASTQGCCRGLLSSSSRGNCSSSSRCNSSPTGRQHCSVAELQARVTPLTAWYLLLSVWEAMERISSSISLQWMGVWRCWCCCDTACRQEEQRSTKAWWCQVPSCGLLCCKKDRLLCWQWCGSLQLLPRAAASLL